MLVQGASWNQSMVGVDAARKNRFKRLGTSFSSGILKIGQ